MNKAIVATIAKQHRQYQTEALAKRRNFIEVVAHPGAENWFGMALTMNEQAMLIIRTEAKMRAIEELAEALGIAEQVAVLAGEDEG